MLLKRKTFFINFDKMSTLDGTTMHPDVALKNEGSMMLTSRNINLHVV